eukprot:gene50601-13301_t
MRDPVVTATGNTYDRHCLLRFWAEKGNEIDPMSNLPLPNPELFPNLDKRREWSTRHCAAPDWGDHSAPLPLSRTSSQHAPRPQPRQLQGRA